jgi:hypothetical protein
VDAVAEPAGGGGSGGDGGFAAGAGRYVPHLATWVSSPRVSLF